MQTSWLSVVHCFMLALPVELPPCCVQPPVALPSRSVDLLRPSPSLQPLLLAGRSAPVQVWDLCSSASVIEAVEWRRSVAAAHAAGTGRLTPGDASTFLSAAVNCSSAGRATPLHAAAEEGDAAQLQALLALGAMVHARDRSGATPLFLACEAGRDQSLEVLLRANAAINVRNAADEAVRPLSLPSSLGRGGPAGPAPKAPGLHSTRLNACEETACSVLSHCVHEQPPAPLPAPRSRSTSQHSRGTSAASTC